MVGLWGASSLVRSIQQGSITPGANASATATISAVDVNHAVAWKLGQLGGASDASNRCTGLTLTNATTVTLSKGTATDAGVTARFVVVEFAPGLIKSIQYATCTIAHASTSATATIAAVDTAKTYLVHNGSTYNTAGAQLATYWDIEIAATDPTTVTATRGNTQDGDAPVVWFVVVELF